MLGGDKALQMFERGYREIVSLPSALAAYREFFTAIAQDAHRPALFHCTTGKDRTGWAAAATLLLLGVSEEDVLYDYELTNRDLLPALKPVFEHFRAAGGDPRLLEPVLGVDADYLRTALNEMTQKFGSIEAYFEEGLGIDSDGQPGCATRSSDHRNAPSTISPPLGLRGPRCIRCNSALRRRAPRHPARCCIRLLAQVGVAASAECWYSCEAALLAPPSRHACNAGAYEIPTIAPSTDCSRATVCPHGSVRASWRSAKPSRRNSSAPAWTASASSTSNSILA